MHRTRCTRSGAGRPWLAMLVRGVPALCLPAFCVWGLGVWGAGSHLRAAEIRVQPLTGAAVAGTVRELTAVSVKVETAEGERQFDSKQLLAVTASGDGTPLERSPKVWIELVDGSQVVGTSYRVKQRQATIELLDASLLKTSTRSIRSVRFNAPNEQIDPQWEKLREATGEAGTDVVAVRPTPNSLDQLEGVIKDVDDERVTFELDGDELPIPRGKLEGVFYFQPAGRELPAPLCLMRDGMGCNWRVKDLKLVGESLQVTTTAGVELELKLALLRNLDYSAGNIVYLSDLEPQQQSWTPYLPVPLSMELLQKWYLPKRDRGFDGGPLAVGEQQFDKGLAIHSRSELVYRLPEKFKRFEAVAGIDPALGELGNVELVVFGDDKQLFRATIRGGQAPAPIELDVQGVRRLRILVDHGEELGIGDHLNLCNARVIK